MKQFEITAYKSGDKKTKEGFIALAITFEEAVSQAYSWRTRLGAPYEWRIERVRELGDLIVEERN